MINIYTELIYKLDHDKKHIQEQVNLTMKANNKIILNF